MPIKNSNVLQHYVLHQGIRTLLLVFPVRYLNEDYKCHFHNLQCTWNLVIPSLCLQFWCSFVGTADGASAIQRCRSPCCGLWCCNEQPHFANTKHLSWLFQRLNERYDIQFFFSVIVQESKLGKNLKLLIKYSPTLTLEDRKECLHRRDMHSGEVENTVFQFVY